MRNQINTDLNSICPYFTMFPLTFPLNILKAKAKGDDVVLDPFCGRGTTNYASRLAGLQSYGIDSSPVAVAISQSKMANAAPKKVVELARHILEQTKPTHIPEGEFWKYAYDKDVLIDLCKIRENLVEDCEDDTKKALRGIVLGALHGPRKIQGSSYFSNQSQRTYAPKPKYAVKYWKDNNLKPQKVDVISIIETRANRYYKDQGKTEGRILRGDSRLRTTFSSIKEKVNWVITSPPYYGMRTYIPDQWLRLWFLGGRPEVDYSADQQLKHSSPIKFVEDLKYVWGNVANVCESNAQLIIRFGMINDRDVDPIEIIKESLEDSEWKCKTIKSAGNATKGYRQARHMNKESSDAHEEFDIWAELKK